MRVPQIGISILAVLPIATIRDLPGKVSYFIFQSRDRIKFFWGSLFLLLPLLLVSGCLFVDKADDEGRGVSVVYEEATDVEKVIKALIVQSEVANRAADLINEMVEMPEDLTLLIGNGDGPAYDPSNRTIYLPYQFVSYIKRLFREAEAEGDETGESEAISDEMLDAIAIDVLEHTLYHEIGHGLVDILNLPIVGREEDAVDNLAVILLIESFTDGEEVALNAADTFWLEGNERDTLEESDFWDEHSLDMQRFYSTLCLIYGSNPNTYEEMMQEYEADPERREFCVDEYAIQQSSWQELLAPYLR